jgi:hypothetical protein
MAAIDSSVARQISMYLGNSVPISFGVLPEGRLSTFSLQGRTARARIDTPSKKSGRCDHCVMLVWLTDWQLAESRVHIAVGDTVDWTLFSADSDWMARLFGGRLAIAWQFDTYGDAVPQPSIRVAGVVVELREVRCRRIGADGGRVPATGEATLEPVPHTSGSRGRHSGPVEPVAAEEIDEPVTIVYGFSYTSAFGDDDTLYGYVATLSVDDDEPAATGAAADA